MTTETITGGPTAPTATRVVPIRWADLESAFERNSPDAVSYLDLTTGEVIALFADAPDYDERRALVAAAPANFSRVEPVSSREQYRWMERFVTCVTDEALLQRLLIAIDGKGAFRRFKDVLTGYPVDRERWFSHRAELLHYHMQVWLAQQGIASTVPAPWGEVEPPQELEPVLERPALTENPGEILRRQAKDLIDGIPAIDLPSGIAFLEFLRDRGGQEAVRQAASTRTGTSATASPRTRSNVATVDGNHAHAATAAYHGNVMDAERERVAASPKRGESANELRYGHSLEEALDSERDMLVGSASPRHPS